MPKLESNLLLLTVNLAQLKNPQRVIQLFIEGTMAVLPGCNMKWHEALVTPNENMYRVCTRQKTYGFVETQKSIEQNEQVYPHFQNALQLLAIILENLEQNLLLNNQKLHLQQLVDQQTNDLIRSHEELNEANEELATTNEELIESNQSLIEINKNLHDEIEKREVLEQKLINSDKFFNHSTDLFCIAGFDGYFKVLNPTWETVLGWSKDELLARPWNDFVHPDDIISTENIKSTIVEGKEIYHFENRYRCKNGDYKWLSWNSYPHHEENIMFGVARDITAITQAEEKLKENETKFRSIIHSSPNGIYIYELNTKGRLIFSGANPSADRIIGIKHELLNGKTIEEAFPNLANTFVPDLYAKVAKGEKPSTNFEIEYADDNAKGYFDVTVYQTIKNAVAVEFSDISERKHAENLIKQSEEKYRTLIEFAPDAFFHGDPNGNFIDANIKASELTGYSINELLKMNMAKLFSNPELTGNPLRYDFLKQGKTVIAERNILRKDKKQLLVEMNSRMLPDGTLQSFVRDITERTKTQDQLRTLTLAINQSPNSIVITNKKGEIEYINPVIEKLSGYTKEELIGQNPRIFASGRTSKREYKELWDTITSGKVWHGEFQNKKKSGELFWESAIISPVFDSKGKITHYLAVREDITKQKKMTQELIAAKEKAEESDRLKSSFLANMSHEIRTPMNSIMGFASLLPEEESKELMCKYANIIVRNSEQLVHIIDDIVLYSRLQTRLLRNMPSAFSVCDLINDVKQSFNLPEYNNLGVELKTENKIGEICHVHTDYEKLRQVFTNLVSNAYKYTPSGSITMGIESKNGKVHFFVKDTGIGIPEKEIDKIFERFYRGSNVAKSTIGGTGLGLSIVKEMIELLGGKIWVESELGQGSTFYFSINSNTE
ncbi:MAG TPA: PAS domain S-box protein [Prolixibacteraceae bacterium]|nr:PAS domain S-box protein [Prolixibacteraceae bacterium]